MWLGDLVAERMSADTRTYEHLPLNVPMDMAAGSYWISAEDRVAFRGRELLCIVRDTDCIDSCCGHSEGFRSVGVVGYVVAWRDRTENGQPVSSVEPIEDETERMEISGILRRTYHIEQIEFL